MRLGKTAVIHFGSNLAVSAMGFVATFAIAYLLGAGGLGEYAIATALGFFWLGIPASAVSTAMRKRISEGTDQAGFLSAGLALNAAIGLLLAVLVYLAGEAIPIMFGTNNEFTRILAGYNTPIAVLILGTYGYKSASSGLQGQKRVAADGVLNAVERVFRTLVQVTLLVIGYGVGALIVGHAITLILAGIVAFAIIGLRPTRPSGEHVARLATFAKYAWVGALRSRVFGWMDTIVLSFFVSASLIGIYEAAWGLASLLAAVSGSIQRTLFPEVSDISTDEAHDKIKHYLDEGLVFAGIFVIPGLLGSIAVGERVLEFYRPEFAKGGGILVLLVLAYGFDVYASQFVNVINAIDYPDVAYRVNLAFIVSNLSLNLILIWAIGWFGAAIATGISTLLRLALAYQALGGLVGRPSVPARQLLLQGAASISMAGLVILIRPYAWPGRLGTIQLVGFGALVYTLILLALSGRVRQKTRSLLPTEIGPQG